MFGSQLEWNDRVVVLSIVVCVLLTWQGFYWVTDRGRKYSKATSAVMQRMRWKDTFNCFFGRRHTKRQEEPSAHELEGGGGGEGGIEGEEGVVPGAGVKRRRQR